MNAASGALHMRSILILAAVALTGCVSYAAEPMTVEEVVQDARKGIAYVDNDYIAARQADNPDLLLIDVRTKAEFDLGHIPGATWIPRGRSEFDFAKTVRDADAEIILYCKTGSRAALVKKALDRQGYQNVSVHEGFAVWAEDRRPIENELGHVTLIKSPDASE